MRKAGTCWPFSFFSLSIQFGSDDFRFKVAELFPREGPTSKKQGLYFGAGKPIPAIKSPEEDHAQAHFGTNSVEHRFREKFI
jgi:hypothetical protein